MGSLSPANEAEIPSSLILSPSDWVASNSASTTFYNNVIVIIIEGDYYYNVVITVMLSLSVIKELSNMPQSQILMKVGLEINVPDLGQRIRDARHKTGRTITQLAAEADISVANWYAIEQERVKVLPLTTLRRIEQVLKFDFGVNCDA